MVVGGGASAHLSRSVLRPDCQDGDMYGLVARGAGSSAVLEGCTVGQAPGPDERGNPRVGLWVEGASLEARGCDIGPCIEVGVRASYDAVGPGNEPGSTVLLEDCRVHDVDQGHCMEVRFASTATLARCTLSGAAVQEAKEGATDGRVGLDVSGRGARACLTDCTLTGGVSASKGASVSLEGATRASAAVCSLLGELAAVGAWDEGTEARLVGGGVQVQGSVEGNVFQG